MLTMKDETVVDLAGSPRLRYQTARENAHEPTRPLESAAISFWGRWDAAAGQRINRSPAERGHRLSEVARGTADSGCDPRGFGQRGAVPDPGRHDHLSAGQCGIGADESAAGSGVGAPGIRKQGLSEGADLRPRR